MKKHKTDRNFLKRPSFPGGNEAMNQFIKQNLKYPKEAIENKIEGVVQIKIHIDHTGKVTNTDLLKGIGYGCDEEAMRVGRLFSFYMPKNISQRIRFFKKVSFKFKLPVQKEPASQQVNIQYTTTSQKQNPSEPGLPAKQTTYTYSIPTGVKSPKSSTE